MTFSKAFKGHGGSPRAAWLGVAVLGALALAAAVSSTALAQTDYARLTVVVRDAASQGAASDADLVDGVTVALSGGRGRERTCMTVKGRCLFRVLDPGDYVITVGGGDFKARTLTFTLTPGQRAVRVVRMTSVSAVRPEIAAASTPTPEPTPDVAPLTQRNSPGRLGAGATREDAELLPNRNRSEEPVIDLLPGVTNAGGDAFSGFIFNGQPGSQNNERIADVDSNVTLVRSAASFQDAGAIFSNLADRRSIKSYSSFSVNTNNTPAKLGTGTGGQLVADISKGKAESEARDCPGHECPIKGEVYEYFSRDRFAARDFFDFAEKPSLSFDLFGLSLSGGPSFAQKDNYPLFFFFANYEGIRASSGNTIFAAAPRLSLRPSAATAVAPLFDAFRVGGATLVEGGTDDPNFDILRLDSKNRARRDGLTLRLDAEANEENSLSFIYIGSATRTDLPDGVTGRRNITRNTSHTAVLNYNLVLTRDADGVKKMQNQVIAAFQSDPVRTFSRTPAGGPLDLVSGAVTISGEVTPTGIEGQPLPLAVATPGSLLPGSEFAHRLNFHPRKLSFADQLTWSGVDLKDSVGSLGPLNFWRAGEHSFTFGGELRFIRASVAQHYGTTYGYNSVDDFLANRAVVTFVGDLGSLTGGETDAGRDASQEYFIAYAQDAWNIRSNMLLNYGVRYEYYTVLREARDRAFAVDPETGQQLSAGAPFYRSRRNNLLPRVAFAWAPNINGDLTDIKNGPQVISASFGMHVGPDVFDNIMRPILSDRVRFSAEGAPFPAASAALAAAFIANEQNRRLRPLAIARGYTSPARVYKFDATYKRELVRRVATSDTDNDDVDVAQELFVTLSYVGIRSEGLLLRNFANPIVSLRASLDPSRPAIACRQFDTLCDEEQALGPYGEFEYLTTGGRADYDSFQVSLRGRARKFLRLFQADYTLARNRGNTDADSGVAAGNPLDYEYDYGYLAADVRHKFNFGALVFLDCGYLAVCNNSRSRLVKELTGGWKFAAIGTFQTGVPIDVRISRPDVVYVDGAGNVHGSPDAGRQPVLNVPGGGSSVMAYRPDLVSGVNPFLDGFGDRRFLNPAAFAIPAPGALGNLRRGELRGPGYRVVDVSLSKEVLVGSTDGLYKRKLTFNVDVTNVFNFTNFRLPSAKLNGVLGTDASKNQLQPGQPFTEAAAGTFGVITRTFKRKYDLGAGRQFQFGVSFKF